MAKKVMIISRVLKVNEKGTLKEKAIEDMEGILLIHSDKKDALLFEGLESSSNTVDKYRVIMEVLDNIISDD